MVYAGCVSAYVDYVSPICAPVVGVDSARYWNTSTGVCAKMEYSIVSNVR